MYHYVRPVNYKSTLSKLLDTLKTKKVIFLPNRQLVQRQCHPKPIFFLKNYLYKDSH